MDIKRSLVLSAVAGMFLGSMACGGSAPPAATDPSAAGSAAGPAAKASCNGADHTDKNHCSASNTTAPSPH